MKGWLVACPKHKCDMEIVYSNNGWNLCWCPKCRFYYEVICNFTKIMSIKKLT